MTREEAVKKITENFWCYFDSEDEAEFFAKQAVTACEEIGMLPPVVELSAGGEFISTKELLNYSEIDYECKWRDDVN